jgi:hypothetical protein
MSMMLPGGMAWERTALMLIIVSQLSALECVTNGAARTIGTPVHASLEDRQMLQRERATLSTSIISGVLALNFMSGAAH